MLDWSGNATFRRLGTGAGGADGLDEVESGVAAVTASGRQYGCDRSGIKTFVLAREYGGQIDVQGTTPNYLAPCTYNIGLNFTIPPAMDVLLSNCDDPGLEGETAAIAVGVPAIASQGQHLSPDGLVYEGTATRSFPPVNETWSWSLRGSR